MNDQEYFQNRKIVAERKAQNDLRFKEVSRKHLRDSVVKKMKTNMIGALAAFENGFGELWGHGIRTPNQTQQEWREIWEEIRAAILDRGNSNIRAVEEEISMYDCSWNRYNTEFVITEKN